MAEDIVELVVAEVMKKVASAPAAKPEIPMPKNPGMVEFVGTAMGDTIGIVIANVDPVLHEKMGFDKKYRSIGILSDRVGAGPQLMAADEAVKATNTEVIKVELPRDTKGGAGHGCLIIFGAEDVSDARRAVEVALKDLPRTFGDVYANEAGHVELQYTARASYACAKAFGTPLGKAFGLCVAGPAGIGVLMVDAALKSADVECLGVSGPQSGLSLTNEVLGLFCGDAGAVRQAIITARDVGVRLLSTLGEPAKSLGVPYI